LSTAEDELEDFLKSRKDWERELAAEQLASKKKPSTSITEKSNKKRISAFGGLSMFSVSAKRGSGLNPPADQPMVDNNDDEEVFTTSFFFQVNHIFHAFYRFPWLILNLSHLRSIQILE
jgi:hypothetical protein